MIPQRLNIFLTLTVCAALACLLLFATDLPLPGLVGAAIVFALLHFSAYCLLHEAEHGLLVKQGKWNQILGVVLGLFFPAPFHLLQQGHLGHHMRNRTDSEAFDCYREDENPWMRRLQMYGTLTGIWWLVVAFSTVFVLIWPLPRLFLPGDRPTQALVNSFRPGSLPLIRLESILILAFYAGLLYLGASIPGALFFYGLAGLLWSSQQYLHHYNTPRHTVYGARNVKTFAWLDALWLNHNWHLNHHISPETPWTELPRVVSGTDTRTSMFRAYLAMWRGPRLTHESLADPHEGSTV